MTIRVGSFVWVERATRRWQPKQNRLRRVTAFFCGKKVGLMGTKCQFRGRHQRYLQLEAGEFFILRQLLTIWMTIRVGSFVWVERATRRWQPKQNRLRRVTAFFCGVKVGLIGSRAAGVECIV